jgi:peptide chain release factor 2
LNTWESVFDIPEKELRLRELAKQSLRESFWSDQNKAREILQEQSRLNDAVTNWKKLTSNVNDLDLLYQIASEEHDEQAQKDISSELEMLEAAVRSHELKMMLASEQDAMNAIMSIHAGAGGTEAQDWAEMLLRMYLRWAERRGLAATIIDYLPGDEAGLKSVTWTLRGVLC